MLQKANIIFSIFYLAFFGLLTSMGVSLIWVKGLSHQRLLATLFCAFLTVIYIVRLIRIKQKSLLNTDKVLHERAQDFFTNRDAS